MTNGINVYLVSPVNENIWEFDPYGNKIKLIAGNGHNDVFWGKLWGEKSGKNTQNGEIWRLRNLLKLRCQKCGEERLLGVSCDE